MGSQTHHGAAPTSSEDVVTDPTEDSEEVSIDDCQRHRNWAVALDVWAGSLCRLADGVRALTVKQNPFGDFFDRVLRGVPVMYLKTTVLFDDSESVMS